MTNAPKYDIGNVVYLRESAALGFLEPARISGISRRGPDWIYSIYVGLAGSTSANLFGDRRSMVHNNTLFFTEEEFVTELEALQLTKSNLERQLNSVNQQITSKYPSNS